MVVLGGWVFFMGEVPLYMAVVAGLADPLDLQGYLAHKKTPTPLGP